MRPASSSVIEPVDANGAGSERAIATAPAFGRGTRPSGRFRRISRRLTVPENAEKKATPDAPAATPPTRATPARPALPVKKPKPGRTEGITFDVEKLTEEDLILGMLCVQHEFINLSELIFCFALQAKAEAKGEGRPTVGEVLLHQRYLTSQDVEYLGMVGKPDTVPTFKDIEAEFLKNVARIAPGAELGTYKIVEEIGRGGMGVVFRAKDLETKEDVALKVLIGGEKSSVRDIERFKKEATVMQPLVHDNIVNITDVGREKGLDYIAMNFVRGKSLKTLVADDGPMSSAAALEVTRQAAEAVGFIHGHGIIHRDIKPDNIMLDDDGRAFLMDFGLAGWEKIEIIQGRGAIGTPMYQPPEQTDVGGPFGKISHASDVYGLGATLYYLLTAKHPFTGKTVAAIRERIRTEPPPRPRETVPQISAEAERICMKCLEKKQDDRYARPKDLAAAIERYLAKKSGAGIVPAVSKKKLATRTGKTGKTTRKLPSRETPGKMGSAIMRTGEKDRPGSKRRVRSTGPRPVGARGKKDRALARSNPELPPDSGLPPIPILAGLCLALVVALGAAIWLALR